MASGKDLTTARISSWEHGHIRGQDNDTAQLKGRYLVARGEAGSWDEDAVDSETRVSLTTYGRRLTSSLSDLGDW